MQLEAMGCLREWIDRALATGLWLTLNSSVKAAIFASPPGKRQHSDPWSLEATLIPTFATRPSSGQEMHHCYTMYVELLLGAHKCFCTCAQGTGIPISAASSPPTAALQAHSSCNPGGGF